MMRLLLIACALLFAAITTHAQQPQRKDRPREPATVRNRANLGAGKPALFSANIASNRVGVAPPKMNALAQLQRAFDASLHDTLVFPYSGLQIKAVVMSKSISATGVQILNLKVISHKNAIMRLEHAIRNGKPVYKGSVVHPDYSDGLVLKVENGNAFFSNEQLFKIINE